MLKLKRKSGIKLFKSRNRRGVKILAKYTLYFNATISLVVALGGITYLAITALISLLVGRLTATSEGIIVGLLITGGAMLATYMFVDLALRVDE